MKYGYLIKEQTSLYFMPCEDCRKENRKEFEHKKYYLVTTIPMSFTEPFIPKSIALCREHTQLKHPKYFKKTKKIKASKTIPLFDGL